MKAANPPVPAFAFDLSRADRVCWSYADKSSELRHDGEPAGFFIDDAEIADQFSSVLDPMSADLLDIAVAVHMADRLALRTFYSSNHWSRRLELRICVRNPEVWGDAAMKPRLERLLQFLTEDKWALAFVKRQDGPRNSEVQSHLFPRIEDGVELSLFSGGLDSFAGTAARISDCSRHIVLVSASPNPQQRFRQQEQVRILRQAFSDRISHVCIPYGMHRGDEFAQERSRRTRGFLFLALGGVTALFARCASLYLYENGLGAINLPYDESQIGTDNARSVHPRVLREIGDLLSIIGNRRFLVLNRSIYQTKSQMLKHEAIRAVKGAVGLTFSCDGFPVRVRGHAQCGFCTSCILRRYSLEAAGLTDEDSDGYLQDWKSGNFRPTKHHLRGLRAMDWQVLRMKKCMASSDPWRATCFEFPELRAVVNDLCFAYDQTPDEVESQLLNLMRRHIADWQNFSALALLSVSKRQVA
jgi:hypothetical protein